MKEQLVFSAAVANKLVKRGFKIIKTMPNLKRPQYDVFVFKNTLDLQAALKSILEEK